MRKISLERRCGNCQLAIFDPALNRGRTNQETLDRDIHELRRLANAGEDIKGRRSRHCVADCGKPGLVCMDIISSRQGCDTGNFISNKTPKHRMIRL